MAGIADYFDEFIEGTEPVGGPPPSDGVDSRSNHGRPMEAVEPALLVSAERPLERGDGPAVSVGTHVGPAERLAGQDGAVGDLVDGVGAPHDGHGEGSARSVVVGAVIIFVSLAASGFWFGSQDDSNGLFVASARTTVEVSEPAELDAAEVPDEPTVASPVKRGPAVTTQDDGSSTTSTASTTVPDDADVLVVAGVVSSDEQRRTVIDAASDAIGGDGVVADQLRVDDGADVALIVSPQLAGAELFDLGSAEVGSGLAVLLDAVPAVLDAIPGAAVVVSGHTDTSGDDELNDQLSLERAEAVAAHLAEGGVDESRLQAVGAGSSQPVADNETLEARRANRRIEIEIEA